ncbi:head-tail connector protein [Filomicrobium insigne]|uniref:head-tail connector protein n=1 Tax=Filomicrobium insigne TaxID=418854 RepID=UPI001FCD0C29|nr:head-tail connector protein [Filomicrobium insigne]
MSRIGDLLALVLQSGPASEPVSVEEAKGYLRIDGNSEDALVSSLILTSRLHVEAALGVALITQDWRLVLDHWPRSGAVRLPLRPLQSVNAVRVFDADGGHATVDPARYVVDTAGTPARLIATVAGWPKPTRVGNGIEIDLTAGYGGALEDVPEPIRQALLLLVAHWYEHRDPIEIGSDGVAIPASVSRLLKPYRMVRV